MLICKLQPFGVAKDTIYLSFYDINLILILKSGRYVSKKPTFTTET